MSEPDLVMITAAAVRRDEERLQDPVIRRVMARHRRIRAGLQQMMLVASAAGAVLVGLALAGIGSPAIGLPGVAVGGACLTLGGVHVARGGRTPRWVPVVVQGAGAISMAYLAAAPALLLLGLLEMFW